MNASHPSPMILALALAWAAPAVADDVDRATTRVRASPESRAERPALAPGKFLVASRQLGDSNFSQTVVLLVDYGQAGAMGLIVNRPTRLPLADAIPELPGLEDRDDRLYAGGPVGRDQLMLLIRAQSPPVNAVEVLADVHVSASLETLQSLLDGGGVQTTFHAFAGYAGWSPGQLDGEVLRGDWRVWPGESSMVFDVDAEEVWPTLIERSAGRWVGAPREAEGAPVLALRVATR